MPTPLDEARAILADPRAPEAERQEARHLLERQHQTTAASDLIAPSAFAPILDAMRAGEPAEDLLKAGASARVPFPGRPGKRSKAGGRSVRVDTMSAQMAGDAYIEAPGAIDFDGLRRMVNGTPILSAIIATRIRQMHQFCSPSEDGGPGFVIRHVDKEHEAEDAEKEQCKLLTRFFTNCGWEFNPRKRKALRRDAFPGLMAKLLRDTLTMDASPIETEMRRDSAMGIDGLYAVDGASIRLCSEEGYEGDDKIFAVQVVSGQIATTYTMDQLIYEVRNPRTDLDLAGYGMAETELLVRVVTAMLNAVTYNADFFDKNSIPKGLLQIFGDYGPEDLGAFKRHWSQMVKGVGNNWGLPVLVSKDKDSGATYTPFNEAADEMAFGRWLTFLTSVACAVYCIDPSEIGFESFAANKSSLSGKDTGEKLASSHAKGLMPIASHFEMVFSDFVVAAFEEDFCFRFVGLQDEDKERIWEAKQLVLTVDEIRAEEGYVPHPDPKIGSLPVNPNLIGPAMEINHPQPGTGDFGAELMPEEPEEQGDDFGAEAPEPTEQGDDFGPEAPPPEPKKPAAKAKPKPKAKK